MNPTKYKELYSKVSNKLNIDKNLVEDSIHFYYANLRSSLTDLDFLNINALGLGNFNIKINSIKKNIYKCENILKKKDMYTMKSYTYFKHKESLLKRLNEIKDKYEKEKLEEKKFKKERNVQLKRNLEK